MDASWISLSVARALIGAGQAVLPELAPELSLQHFVASLEQLRLGFHESGPRQLWLQGAELPLASLGLTGRAIADSPSLGQALRALAQGFPLIQSDTQLQVISDADEVHIIYRVLDPRIWPRRGDAELSLGLFHAICGSYGINRQAVRALTFEHGCDGNMRAISDLTGVTPLFNAEDNRISLSVSALSLGRKAGPEQTGSCTGSTGSAQRLRALDQAVAAQRRHMRLSLRVRSQLLQGLGQRDVSQQKLAAELGMSERSLRRGLALEGLAFHEILENCRRIQAEALLVRSDRPLSEVALLLGYSDQTAFSRAASRWFGTSPRNLRRAAQAGSSDNR